MSRLVAVAALVAALVLLGIIWKDSVRSITWISLASVYIIYGLIYTLACILSMIHSYDKLTYNVIREQVLGHSTELASEALGLPARMVSIGCCIRSVAVD